MKKQLFTFVMMIALVIGAGSAMGQTSTTPYKGSTHKYTITGIDVVGADRAIEVFLTLDNETTPESARITTANFIVSNGSGITNPTSAGTAASSWGYAATLTAVNLPLATPASFSFDVTWTSALTADAKLNLWVKVYDGASGTCSNMMHLDVTPKTDALDYSIAADFASVCPTTEVPANQGVDGIATSTIVSYTVTRSGGITASNWSFTFDGGTINVAGGSDTKVVTTTVTNTPGTAITVAKSISGFKQFVGTTTTVNSTSDKISENNSATTTITRAPSIGTFTGN